MGIAAPLNPAEYMYCSSCEWYVSTPDIEKVEGYLLDDRPSFISKEDLDGSVLTTIKICPDCGCNDGDEDSGAYTSFDDPSGWKCTECDSIYFDFSEAKECCS